MKEGILLIASVDDTFRKPLLENQGYRVQLATADEAFKQLQTGEFRLALINTEPPIANTLATCEKMKTSYPDLRIGLVAQRAEYIPNNGCVDAVIRSQYSPNKFLSTIRYLMESRPDARSAIAPYDDDGD